MPLGADGRDTGMDEGENRSMNEHITATDIRKALENKYAPPEWYLGFEVGNSTGGPCNRHADAVAISSWPSRGFTTIGFEIKVSRSDLKSEIENGIKADEIARYCDYWFLVTPKGLSNGFTLPATWGLLEYTGAVLRQKKDPTPLDRTPPTLGFLCAMLRGRERLLVNNAKAVAQQEREQIEQRVRFSCGDAEKRITRINKKIDQIETMTGIRITEWTPDQDIVDMLNTTRMIPNIAYGARDIQRSAKRLYEEAEKVLAKAEMLLPKEVSK